MLMLRNNYLEPVERCRVEQQRPARHPPMTRPRLAPGASPIAHHRRPGDGGPRPRRFFAERAATLEDDAGSPTCAADRWGSRCG